MMGWGWNGGGWNGGGSWGIVNGVLSLVFLVVVVVGVFLVVRHLLRSQPPRPEEWGLPNQGRPFEGPSPNGLRILEDRYARGEIDRQEFLERKQDLMP